MERQIADEVIAALEGDRTLFHYYRDRYSLGLLRYMLQKQGNEQLSSANIKQSPYAPLLQKTRVKNLFSATGGKALNAFSLAQHDYDSQQEAFILTLGLWGSERKSEKHWRQISRSGFNLVLQLNFSRRHDLILQGLAQAGEADHKTRFNHNFHPVSTQRNTLAWARIDFDWDLNCALIEEIQSDWIRRVAVLDKRIAFRLQHSKSTDEITTLYGLNCSLNAAQNYCRAVLATYQPIWAEAMLWASISFLREELGINSIFYHTEKSGQRLKNIKGDLPPRSLYSDLPRKFCLQKSEEIPAFLLKDKISQKVLQQSKLEFFKLE